jgi:hypothetical protein
MLRPLSGAQPFAFKRVRRMDNVFSERLWRSLKYEYINTSRVLIGSTHINTREGLLSRVDISRCRLHIERSRGRKAKLGVMFWD